ncbi:hypothetical protein [Natronomonas amylolytica]|uniref:hypothetical protein n=1 Tax=Natronomonas amylolytica TaxID=3108498 RepID=UPI0030084CCB
MTDDNSGLQLVSAPEESTVRTLVRAGLALVGLLTVVGLLAVTPGIDRLLAGLAVSPWALGLAVVTLLVVGVLLWIAPEVERAALESVDGPDTAVENAAAAAKLLVGFLAVAIAYRGFAPAFTPAFRAFDIGGVYHLGFLVVGLVVLAAFARRLYRCWEPVTEMLTDYAVDASGRETERVSSEQ